MTTKHTDRLLALALVASTLVLGAFAPSAFANTQISEGAAAQTASSKIIAAAAGAEPVGPIMAEPQKGTAVIVGGGLSKNNAAVWSAFLDAARSAHVGKSGPVRIAVLATASGVADEAVANTKQAIELHSKPGQFDVFELPVRAGDVKAAGDAQIATMLDDVSGVWFTGGDQSRITDTLTKDGRDRPVMQAIRAVVLRGGVLGGTSAGAAIMSRIMISGGSSERWLTQLFEKSDDKLSVESGLAFVGDMVVDQHFISRGRIGRLASVLASQSVKLGLGIADDHAVVVNLATGSVRAIGTPTAVVVLDARSAVRARIESKPASADGPAMAGYDELRGLRFWLMGGGDELLPPGSPAAKAAIAERVARDAGAKVAATASDSGELLIRTQARVRPDVQLSAGDTPSETIEAGRLIGQIADEPFSRDAMKQIFNTARQAMMDHWFTAKPPAGSTSVQGVAQMPPAVQQIHIAAAGELFELHFNLGPASHLAAEQAGAGSLMRANAARAKGDTTPSLTRENTMPALHDIEVTIRRK